MKTISGLLTKAISAIFVALFIGCLPLTDADKEKQCKENQLATPSSEQVNYIMTLTKYDHYPDQTHILFNSIGLDIVSDVYLIDCFGLPSDHQSYDHSFAPAALIPLATSSYDLPAISGLRFTFHNSREYLQVKYTLKAFFADGTVYQSDTMTSNSYRYSTLNQYSKPLKLKLYQDGLAWNKLP